MARVYGRAQRLEKGVGCLRPAVTAGCKLLMWSGPLEKQQGLLTTGPSLQPLLAIRICFVF